MAGVYWVLLAMGCVEQWCERFNLQCESTDLEVPDVVDEDLDGWAEDDDCDDLNYNVNPSAIEVCNAVDDNCDGEADDGMPSYARWFFDNDRDGFGGSNFVEGCVEEPEFTTEDPDDCYDFDATVNPDAAEVCNGIDDDCDKLTDDDDPNLDLATSFVWYTDDDGDGYGVEATKTPITACNAPSPTGWATPIGDCDDTDPLIHPDLPEVCGNGIDDDCDGVSGDPGVCQDLSTGDAAASLFLARSSDGLGASLIALPDGATQPTLAIAAPGLGVGGAVYVGSPNLSSRAAPSSLGIAWTGADADSAGSVLAALPDYSGPLAPGLLVGAPGDDTNPDNHGVIYLLRDPNDGGGALIDAAVAIDGTTTGGVIGGAIATGDLDGDTLLDAAVVATSATPGASAVWIWSRVGATQEKFDDSSRLWTSSSTPYLGRSVAVGDLDGDGTADVVVGVGVDTGGAPTEQVHLALGPFVDERTVDDSDWWAEGMSSGATQGTRVFASGDHDGDGLTDILVTCPSYDGVSYGAVALYTAAAAHLGRSDGPTALLQGASTEATLGAQAGNLGDTDGDGVDDLVAAFPTVEGGSIDLWYGPLTGTSTVEAGDHSFSHASEFERFGTFLSAPIDLDGDLDMDLAGSTSPDAKLSAGNPSETFFFLVDY